VLAAADEVCGWTKGKCRHGETWWWDESVKRAFEDKKEKFKEWKRDKMADAKSKYNKAKKFAKRAVSIAMREASERLMKEMENDKSSKIMLKIAKQSMKDNKDVVGNGCVRDRSGKLCMGRGKELKYGKNVWRE
jgi:hypothetical protein